MDEAWLVAADVEATFDFISCQVEKKDQSMCKEYYGVPCPRCGSKDLWYDETMWGCNVCGAMMSEF